MISLRDIQAQFRNVAPRNPTQTAFLRFLKGPKAEWKTAFTDAQDALEAFSLPKNSLLKTPFDDLLWDWKIEEYGGKK